MPPRFVCTSHDDAKAENLRSLSPDRLTAWFWGGAANKLTLLAKIKRLAAEGLHVPSFPQHGAHDTKLRFKEIFKSVRSTDTAGLTATEQYLLSDASDLPHERTRRVYVSMTTLDVAGSLDRETAMLRLEQTKRYVEELALLIPTLPVLDGSDTQLTQHQKEELGAQLLRAAITSFNIKSPIYLLVKEEQNDPNDVAGYDPRRSLITLYPNAFRGSLINLIDAVFHEAVHAKQMDEGRVAMDELKIRDSRTLSHLRAIEGPLRPLSESAHGTLAHDSMNIPLGNVYPADSYVERDAWMTAMALKIYLSCDPRFSKFRTDPSLEEYTRVGVSMLEAHGPEGILSLHVKNSYGVDLHRMAVLCGVRPPDGQAFDSGKHDADILFNLKDTLHKITATTLVADAKTLFKGFQNDMLSSIGDVIAASQDFTHIHQRDARLLVAAVQFVSQDTPNEIKYHLFEKNHSDDIPSFLEKCGSEIFDIETEFGRSLLFHLADVHLSNLNHPDYSSEHLRKAIWPETHGDTSTQ